jgi:metallophosphoesterase (TIGR00282 family)
VSACEKVCRALGKIKSEYGIDFTVANGENAAAHNDLDRSTAGLLLGGGIDVLTSGNHIFQKRDMLSYIDENPYIIRPANYPFGTPGKGSFIFESFGLRILVMNVLGTTFLEPLSCPFEAVEKMLREKAGQYDISILDVHAEATSEKLALAHVFDGRIAAMFGTHTHVQTADEQILPHGSGYITDLGMTGPTNGILGTDAAAVVAKFRTHMPQRFTVAQGKIQAAGALFEIDPNTGKCLSVKRITF